jgi:hypothetical protein
MPGVRCQGCEERMQKLPSVRPCRCAASRHCERRCATWVLAKPVMPLPSWPAGFYTHSVPLPLCWLFHRSYLACGHLLSPALHSARSQASPRAAGLPLRATGCRRFALVVAVRSCPGVRRAHAASQAASRGPLAPPGHPRRVGSPWAPGRHTCWRVVPGRRSHTWHRRPQGHSISPGSDPSVCGEPVGALDWPGA